MERRKILHRILGESLEGLSKGELAVANRVLDYFVPSCSALASDDAVLAACKYAVSGIGAEWEDVMLSRNRSRRVVEVRYSIFHIFYNRTSCAQRKVTAMLGGVFDRTTILYGVDVAEDLRNANGPFAQKYATLARLVEDYLSGKGDGNNEG